MGNILVMDVEGTDGRERGEDQDFERKSALFALATSEVMVRSCALSSWCSYSGVAVNCKSINYSIADRKHLGTPSRAIPGRKHGALKDGL